MKLTVKLYEKLRNTPGRQREFTVASLEELWEEMKGLKDAGETLAWIEFTERDENTHSKMTMYATVDG